MNIKWINRFKAMAKMVSTWSEDANKQVGCVIVSPDRRQFSTGHNGLPRGLELVNLKLAGVIDDFERKNKNSVTIHAELNAILNSAVDVAGWSLFVTEPPCLQCACAIVQKQIAEVYIPKLKPDSNWFNEQVRAVELLCRSGIRVNSLEE